MALVHHSWHCCHTGREPCAPLQRCVAMALGAKSSSTHPGHLQVAQG